MRWRGPLRLARHLLLVMLIGGLLGAGLFVGDNWARERVEERSAAALQEELGTPTPPSVEIAHFPFLTQAISGRLKQVHVVAQDVGTATGAKLQVQHLDLMLYDVTSSDRFATMAARSVDGRAELDFDDLRRLTGLDLTSAGGDRVALRVSTTVLGSTLTATVTGRPVLDVAAQTVTLTEPTLTVAGREMPPAVARWVVRTLLRPVPVTVVPYGLRLPALELSEAGLTAGLTGTDVELSR
jgi:hypothetical protein